MKYLIILEPPATGFSACSPDLDDCVAAGDDRAETIEFLREAIAFHLEGMAREGSALPVPSSQAEYIEVST